ncbi:hypothetical protein GGR53DRAFT_498468 [Hypoxylon sp. FL1150]|nr:hypothetical protein GGR53DRAFT_498468 [Hypoxylon sp. FL1150]
MREKGQLVKRGTLGEDGDVEFWEDGTVTQRGGGATSSSSDSTGVKDELDALSEQEAAISREARDTSSQSAEPANRTSTPLSNAGNRPSLDSTPHTNSVPSTRRQYSTNNNYRLDSDDNEADPSGGPPLHSRPTSPLNRVSKEEMIEYAKKHIATKRGIDVDSSPHAKRALGYETRSQPKNGYTDADPMKDGYSSVRRSQPLSHNNEILPRVPVRATKSETEAQSFNIRYFRRRKMRYRDREVTPMKSPTPRIVFSQPTYRGVRFYDIDTVDNRPRYIRTGPGRLKKKRRPLQPNAAARHPLRRLRATSEAHDSKASTKLIRKERARARNSALIEQAVARRSKESNEFIRLPS